MGGRRAGNGYLVDNIPPRKEKDTEPFLPGRGKIFVKESMVWGLT